MNCQLAQMRLFQITKTRLYLIISIKLSLRDFEKKIIKNTTLLKGYQQVERQGGRRH